MQIFCIYSAHMEENANKLHFIASTFVIHPQISMLRIDKIKESLKVGTFLRHSVDMMFNANKSCLFVVGKMLL